MYSGGNSALQTTSTFQGEENCLPQSEHQQEDPISNSDSTDSADDARDDAEGEEDINNDATPKVKDSIREIQWTAAHH